MSDVTFHFLWNFEKSFSILTFYPHMSFHRDTLNYENKLGRLLTQKKMFLPLKASE